MRHLARILASIDNTAQIHGKQVVSPCKTAAAEDWLTLRTTP